MDIVDVISKVGFPIAVAVYLLIKIDNTMSKFDATVQQLVQEIGILIDRYEPGRGDKN